MIYDNFYKYYFPQWAYSESNSHIIGKENQRMFGDSGEEPLTILENIFNIPEDTKREIFREKFEQAISGDGKEKTRILTLHSSSLLALMNFWQVNESNPLFYDGVEYTKVYFECKNTVIPGRKPSNIDVVLVSRDGETIIFLESKFTEILEPRKTWLAEAYKPFYDRFKSEWNGLIEVGRSEPKTKKVRGVPTETMEFAITSVNSQRGKAEYLGGIKQLISHLIGIINGPDQSIETKYHLAYTQDFRGAKKIKLGTILFSLQGKDEEGAFKRYQNLYTACFGSKGLSLCYNILRELNQSMEDLRSMEVLEKALTYQELFGNENRKILLPKVREMYYSNPDSL